MTGTSAVALPIASLFWKMLACAGINTGVNTLQRAAWADMDGLEDKAGYIFDPEQMMVEFGNGMSIGITVPKLVAMKPKPPGVDVEPPKGLNYDQENTVSSARGSDDVDPPEGSGEGGSKVTGTYGTERGIAYMSLRKAGLTLDPPTRIPGNRRQ